MGRIVIEFGTPNAKNKARESKHLLIVAIEEAILKLKNADVKIFGESEFTVYFTFKEEATT